MDERELETRVYGMPTTPSSGRPEPDPIWIHTELKRVGVTLELLHLGYLAEHEGQRPYQYTAFCNRYRKWLKAQGLSMRQSHRAGDNTFVDFSGKRPRITDPLTGKAVVLEFFVQSRQAMCSPFGICVTTNGFAPRVSPQTSQRPRPGVVQSAELGTYPRTGRRARTDATTAMEGIGSAKASRRCLRTTPGTPRERYVRHPASMTAWQGTFPPSCWASC